jgi:hypothetical protein
VSSSVGSTSAASSSAAPATTSHSAAVKVDGELRIFSAVLAMAGLVLVTFFAL